jgi:hypothetical protein
MQGYTFNSSERIVLSGDTRTNAEMLTEIRGSSALGYSPAKGESRPGCWTVINTKYPSYRRGAVCVSRF